MQAGPDRCRELLEKALECAGAEQAEGLVSIGREAVTRFAAGRIHQNVSEEDAAASFRVALGGRVGGARTNGLDESRLADCARRAAAIARAQDEDPEFPGLVASPPAENAPEGAYDEATAAISPEDRAKICLPAIERAREAGFEASGALTVASSELAVANTLGTFQYHPSTTARLHVVVRAGTAEGAWTETANSLGEIDPEAVAARAVEKCASSRDPARIEPGEYPMVLEPDAVADMVEMLAYMGLGALSVLEDRSFLCGRTGERIVSEKITLSDDPLAPGGPVRPFDYEGVPKRKVVLIERGVARTPVYDTRTASRASRALTGRARVESTGHALPEPNPRGPFPLNLVLAPGDAALDEMIASTERGLLVSRFHYTNPVDPKRTVITGMTRFGTFLIEDGKVAKAVKPLRFTDSVLEGLSRAEAVGGGLRRVEDTLAPSLKLSSWRFTGVTGD